jgi:hypothetical protein
MPDAVGDGEAEEMEDMEMGRRKRWRREHGSLTETEADGSASSVRDHP